jgi:hypothetical protein
MNPETPLQNDILKAISAIIQPRGGMAWRQTVGRFRTPDGKRFVNCGPDGAADIMGVLPGGRAFGCEVKTPDGEQEESQIRFEKAFKKAGGIYFIAKSVEEATRLILLHLPGDKSATT